MSRAPFLVIDGRLYRWKDILELRRAQLAAAGAAEASQLALFATLHDGRSNKGEPPMSDELRRGLFARFNRMGLIATGAPSKALGARNSSLVPPLPSPTADETRLYILP